jgi:isopenicillin N synthase-like dioxygenase
MKLAKYPSVTNISRLHDGDDSYLTSSDSNTDLSQGVGPHRDSGFITLISQDAIGGLQVQLFDGTWADVPPKDGTLVVNLGEMSSALTGCLFVATTHRVLNNTTGRTRYSIPFFLAPHLDAELLPIPLPADLLSKIPKEVKTDVHAKRAKIYSVYGLNYMKGRLRSHPDVARRWWGHVDPENLDVWEKELEEAKAKAGR